MILYDLCKIRSNGFLNRLCHVWAKAFYNPFMWVFSLLETVTSTSIWEYRMACWKHVFCNSPRAFIRNQWYKMVACQLPQKSLLIATIRTRISPILHHEYIVFIRKVCWQFTFASLAPRMNNTNLHWIWAMVLPTYRLTNGYLFFVLSTIFCSVSSLLLWVRYRPSSLCFSSPFWIVLTPLSVVNLGTFFTTSMQNAKTFIKIEVFKSSWETLLTLRTFSEWCIWWNVSRIIVNHDAIPLRMAMWLGAWDVLSISGSHQGSANYYTRHPLTFPFNYAEYFWLSLLCDHALVEE